MDKELLILCEMKVNRTTLLTWDAIAKTYGYSSGESLRCAYKVYRQKNGTLPSREEKISRDVEDKLTEIDMKMIDLQKERVKLSDQKKGFNRLIRESARKEDIIEEITNAIIEGVEEGTLKDFKVHKRQSSYAPKFWEEPKYEMVVCFSDFHYGLSVDNYWNKTDADIFVKRLTEYINKIIDIGEMFSVSRIVVLNLGDVISGNIHTGLRVENKKNIIKQVQEVTEYIALALYELSLHFDNVDYYSAIGNHGRVTANKHESITDENFESFVSWYLKPRLSAIDNITINDNVIDKDVIVAKVKGHTITGSHGDKDTVKNIVSNMTHMIKEIPVSCYLGHLHHYAEDTIQGVNVIMSGSLIGTDTYAKDIRCFGSACQTVCLYDENGKVCSFNVVLS